MCVCVLYIRLFGEITNPEFEIHESITEKCVCLFWIYRMLKNRFAFIAIYHQRQAHRRKKHSSMSYRNWNIHIVKRNQKIVKLLPHRRYHFPILPINRLQLAAFWWWRMKFVAVLQCAVMREWFLPNLDQRCRPAFRQSLLVPFNFSAHTFQRYWSIDLAERFVEIIWCWEKNKTHFLGKIVLFFC